MRWPDLKKLSQLAGSDTNLHAELRFGRSLLYAVALFILIALIWARFAVLDEVTMGQGKVIPTSQIQTIQNLEGGILAELLVKEGQVVDRDQVLLRIDDTKFVSSYREGRARYLALLAANARLTAQANGSGRPVYPPEIAREMPNLIRIENSLFDSQIRALNAATATLYQSYLLAKEELERTAPLIGKGAVSEVEILRLQRQVNDLKGQVEDRRNKFRADAQAELNKNQAEMGSLTETNISSQDRVARTVVRSPMRGIVKKINVMTIGGIIQPGMDIMAIVPIEDTLLIEAQVRPADIAFLRLGQQAMVKVTAYDYSIYGGLEGRLEHISADTISEDKRVEAYYIIRVRTGANHLGGEEAGLPIIPGMTVSVEILTGHKSVLGYLMKPFLKTVQKAMRER